MVDACDVACAGTGAGRRAGSATGLAGGGAGRPRPLLQLGNLGDKARHLCLARPELLRGLRIFVGQLLLARLELFDALLHQLRGHAPWFAATAPARLDAITGGDALSCDPAGAEGVACTGISASAAASRTPRPAARRTPALPAATRNRHIGRRPCDDGFCRFAIGRLRDERDAADAQRRKQADETTQRRPAARPCSGRNHPWPARRRFLLHPVQFFGQPRELLIGTRDLSVRMRQPFVGPRGQVCGRPLLISASLRNSWALLSCPVSPHKGGPICPQSSQALNEGLTKARPQHEEVAASLGGGGIEKSALRRTKTKCPASGRAPCSGILGGGWTAGSRRSRNPLQVFGAAGYSRNKPLERMVRDARMFTIGGGSAQILRTVVASTNPRAEIAADAGWVFGG